jgi:hypothetical protein
MSDIPALEANVEEIDRQIARLERRLEAKRLERQLTVNDIAAARLQAWYRDNPGIYLAVGDQLAVTDEMCASDGLLDRGDTYIVKEVGAVITVYNEIFDYVRASNGVYVNTFSISDARRMREAWLAQEAQS